MSARRKRVISTEEIQFNHKPAKMLLTEKRRESAKMAKPQVKLGSAHIVYYIGQYLSDVKHCSIQSWPRGGLSSWPMMPTTRNLTAPPTPRRTQEKWGKSTDRKHNVISSEGGVDTPAWQISCHSLQTFSSECTETPNLSGLMKSNLRQNRENQ